MPNLRPIISIISVIVVLTASSEAMAQMKQVMRYCKPDAERLCPGVQPGAVGLLDVSKPTKWR